MVSFFSINWQWNVEHFVENFAFWFFYNRSKKKISSILHRRSSRLFWYKLPYNSKYVFVLSFDFFRRFSLFICSRVVRTRKPAVWLLPLLSSKRRRNKKSRTLFSKSDPKTSESVNKNKFRNQIHEIYLLWWPIWHWGLNLWSLSLRSPEQIINCRWVCSIFQMFFYWEKAWTLIFRPGHPAKAWLDSLCPMAQVRPTSTPKGCSSEASEGPTYDQPVLSGKYFCLWTIFYKFFKYQQTSYVK